jgi:lipopolysaccharide heptosyltransferase II
MAGAIIRLLTDRKLVDAMVLEGRQRVEELYTLELMAQRTIAVYEELKNSLNVLVIKLSAVGDVILSTASLQALRLKYPKARISVLVGREGAAVLYGCPYIDDVIVYDYRGKDQGVKGFWNILKRLRKYRFDKVIDFQNTNRSHLLGFFCFPRASYGYRNKKLGFLLSDGILDNVPNLPPVAHQFRVLNKLGIVYDDSVRIQMWPRPDDVVYARELLHSEWIDEVNHLVVGVNISASERWPSKNWSMKSLAELCDMLAAENIRVVITGMEKDFSMVKDLKGHLKSKPAIFVGKTNLFQLSALLGLCRVYVSSDSAPLHVAAAMKTPVVALFGPTSPQRHLPPAEQIRVICRDLSCHPCYQAKCKSARHRCMNEITANEVFLEVKKFLLSGKQGTGKPQAVEDFRAGPTSA